MEQNLDKTKISKGFNKEPEKWKKYEEIRLICIYIYLHMYKGGDHMYTYLKIYMHPSHAKVH